MKVITTRMMPSWYIIEMRSYSIGRIKRALQEQAHPYMKFLIVDDDKSIVEAVTIGLQFQWQDAEAHTAADGEEGLHKFLELAPDVTLLDINMPHMSGFEVLQRIREVSDAPVFMLTARGDE